MKAVDLSIMLKTLRDDLYFTGHIIVREKGHRPFNVEVYDLPKPLHVLSELVAGFEETQVLGGGIVLHLEGVGEVGGITMYPPGKEVQILTNQSDVLKETYWLEETISSTPATETSDMAWRRVNNGNDIPVGRRVW